MRSSATNASRNSFCDGAGAKIIFIVDCLSSSSLILPDTAIAAVFPNAALFSQTTTCSLSVLDSVVRNIFVFFCQFTCAHTVLLVLHIIFCRLPFLVSDLQNLQKEVILYS